MRLKKRLANIAKRISDQTFATDTNKSVVENFDSMRQNKSVEPANKTFLSEFFKRIGL